MTQEYIGDGVYVEWDGFHLILMANSPHEPTDIIYLEDTVIAALLDYLKRHDIIEIKAEQGQ